MAPYVTLLTILLAPLLTAQPSTIITFRDASNDTVARGINNQGQIVGYSTPAGTSQSRGFLRAPDGSTQNILAPGANDTRLHGINNLGEIVGSRENNTRAILRNAAGQFTEIVVPDATSAAANAINNNGYVVGGFQRMSTTRRAFLRNLAGGIVVLGEIITGDIEAVSIANTTDRVLLTRTESSNFSAIHLNTPTGTFEPQYINLPNQTVFGRHIGRGINASNIIVGEIEGRGFLARASATGSNSITDGVVFSVPNAAATLPYGINDNNQIVGALRDAAGALTAFRIDPCSPTLTTTTRAHGSGSEAGTIPLATDGSFCLWIASTNTPWISFTRSIGSGPGSVAYTLQPNTTNAERQGTIRIGTREFTITQASSDCHYTVTPPFGQSIPSQGGTINFTIATTPGCPWTAYSPEDWIQFSTTSGTGNGSVTAQISPFPLDRDNQRFAPINVAGTTISVVQLPAPCNLQLSRTTINVPVEGALESIRVNLRQGCSWNPSYNVSWITTLGAQFMQPGSGTLSLRIDRNNGNTPRNTTIVINTSGPAGPLPGIITIRQAAASACSYSLPITSADVSADSFVTSFLVQTGESCPINATSDVPWLRIAGPTDGTFAANTVGLVVDRNPSRLPRRGRIHVNGLTYTVDQFGSLFAQLGFVPINACRILDTRDGQGFTNDQGPPAFAAGQTRTVRLFGRCNLPFTAKAVVLNVTAIPLDPLAFLTVFAPPGVRPLASTLNSWNGRTVSNLAVIPSGDASIYASDRTHVIADVIGYFADPNLESLVLYPVTPCRLLDTRTTGNAPIPANTTRHVQVAGQCGISSFAGAYSLNITAIPRSTTLESLTVFPTGANRPTATPLNAAPGRVVASAALLAPGFEGNISIHASHETDVVVDVNGYFALPSDSGLYFNALTPCRIADTRVGTGGVSGPLLPAITRTINPAANVPQCNVPAEAKAHLVNATVVPDGPTAFLSLFPSPAWTGSSTLNAYDGQVTANLAIVPDNGQGIGALASNPTHLVLDTSGYFMAVPADQRRPAPLSQDANTAVPSAK